MYKIFFHHWFTSERVRRIRQRCSGGRHPGSSGVRFGVHSKLVRKSTFRGNRSLSRFLSKTRTKLTPSLRHVTQRKPSVTGRKAAADKIVPTGEILPRSFHITMQLQKKSLKKTTSATPKKLPDYEERFAELYDKALALGLSPKELCALTGVKRLQSVGTTTCRLARFFGRLVSLVRHARPFCRYMKFLTALLLLAVIFQCCYFGLHSQKGWVSLFVEREKLETEPCVVDMPARVQNGMMPPLDCKVCQDLRRVSRRSSLSHLDFESKHAYSGVPVVVTDGASNWTALQSFSLNFFKDLYQDAALRMSRSACQFFPYKTEFKSLEEVLNMTAERSKLPWYIGCDNGAKNHFIFLSALTENL
ncbi:hypothetical protein V5799_015406 [Amblyomma americanum]|uniref:Uncharacterized protein n=1 Tax=Amblyomma americanum TaxID=6943 RepID=A0AAQ4F7V0_AMBAM